VIILDTNVLSALMLDTPEEAVLRWLNSQARLSIWTTTVTLFEIRFGALILPPGRRQASLLEDLQRCLDDILHGRIVEFDAAAAEEAAALAAQRRRQGRSGDLRDTMIAGIVIAHRATLATRNTRHFDDLPVPVVNPWAD
jgi:predicted nucleic acid-binding protein